jgi:16S rRNA (uracil1498-N3)-methyltransferase
MAQGPPRLFVEAPLGAGASVALDRSRAHYIQHVLRRGPGTDVLLFNGRDGEWRARIADIDKRGASLLVEDQRRLFAPAPDLRLLFAPLKQARLDLVIEKATELGVARLVPVLTRHGVVPKLNAERLHAIAVEAAEQSERLDVPAIDALLPLDRVLAAWDRARPLILLDETGGVAPLADRLATFAAAGASPLPALLIGPEGGFAEGELDALSKLAFVTRAGLGPRVLRAETAAQSALTLWQAHLGDWRAPAPRRRP